MISIGEFSKISNVTTKTLRYYDEINLIKPAVVKDNGYRYYSIEQLKDILMINKLKQYDFSLEEISEVLKEPYNDMVLCKLMKEKQSEIKNKINNYQFVLNQIENDILNLERGINIMAYLDKIEVKLVEVDTKNLLYLRQKINIEDYGKYMGKLFEIISKDKLTPVGAPMTIYHDEEFNPICSDVEIAIPVKEVVTGTREMKCGLCAMATLKGPYSELVSIYAKLVSWVETEGFKIANSPFELYMTDPTSGISPEEYITEVYFPVKK